MTTRFIGKWLILGIDLFMIAVSFFLAYFIRFNLNMNFNISKMVIQLLLVLPIALMAFLITDSYKGVFIHPFAQNVRNIFKAICLLSVFVFLLFMVNRALGIYPEYSLALSIIIIFSLLSFIGLAGSRYLFKVL